MSFPLKMPKLSPTMSEGTIAEWLKKEGEFIEDGEPALSIATDKASIEYAPLEGGWLQKILVPEGGEMKVNEPIALLTKEKDGKVEELPTPPPKEEKQESTRLFASPLAKRLAKEKDIDLTTIHGTGPGGRIMRRDLQEIKAKIVEPPKEPVHIKEEAVSPMRRTIGDRLQMSKATIPHFYLQQTLQVDELVAIRERGKKEGYTINDFIVKATAIALEKHPEVNCGYNNETKKKITFPSVDVCVAVTIPGGLVTPIIKECNSKPLNTISKEIKELATRAREGKLSPHEYQGGSFTISNLGMYGITSFEAIINPPQGAILSIGAIHNAPVVKDGVIQPGKELTLTLSSDHRIIDGAEAAQFIKTLRELLENPILFLSR